MPAVQHLVVGPEPQDKHWAAAGTAAAHTATIPMEHPIVVMGWDGMLVLALKHAMPQRPLLATYTKEQLLPSATHPFGVLERASSVLMTTQELRSADIGLLVADNAHIAYSWIRTPALMVIAEPVANLSAILQHWSEPIHRSIIILTNVVDSDETNPATVLWWSLLEQGVYRYQSWKLVPVDRLGEYGVMMHDATVTAD